MPTYINGQEWHPVWRWQNTTSLPYHADQPLLPQLVSDRIRLTKKTARGKVIIKELSSEQNDYTLSILIDDAGSDHKSWYEFVIEW